MADDSTGRAIDLVRSELLAAGAATAADLADGGPPRLLRGGAPRPLPHSGGRTLGVPVLLERGPPSHLRVDTELGLTFMVRVGDDGAVAVTDRPSRADLAAAVGLALAGEQRALEAAAAALAAAGVAPPGASWAEALRTARLDPRLPADRVVGAPPTWSMIFEPWIEARGFNMVLLDAGTFAVQLVNGRPP
jgi:hypothetical protein